MVHEARHRPIGRASVKELSFPNLLDEMINAGRLPREWRPFASKLAQPKVHAVLAEPILLFSRLQTDGFLEAPAFDTYLAPHERTPQRRSLSASGRRLLSQYARNIHQHDRDAIAHLLLSTRTFNWLRNQEVATISALEEGLSTGTLWRFWPTLSAVEAALKLEMWKRLRHAIPPDWRAGQLEPER